MIALLLAPVLAASLLPAAQLVDSVTPASGAYGSQLVIAGSGFGEKKARVLLVSDDDGKSRKLKVLKWTDTEIRVELRKLPAGSHQLNVQLKGKGLEPAAAPEPVTVELPSDAMFAPTSAGPGEEVTLTAQGLGTKKGSVKVGGVKAKVLSWDGGSDVTEGAAVGTVVFKLGKKTPPGSQPVNVKTTAGEAVFVAGLDVTEPQPGGGPGIPGNPFSQAAPGLSCEMNGELKSFAPVYKSPQFGATTNWKVVGQADAGFTTFDIRLLYDAPAGPTKTKAAQAPQVHLIYATLSSIYSTTLNPGVGDIIPGASAAATYTGLQYVGPPGFQQSSFGGAFSGTMVRVEGTGPDTLTITNGFFWTASTSP